MKITCIEAAICQQVLDLLHRHGVTHGIHWDGGSPVDERTWIIVHVAIDSTVEAAIRRDIGSIAGAAVQE